MDNQHQKIKGYRDLTQAEIDLMNKIKAHGEAANALLRDVQAHLRMQADSAASYKDSSEELRIETAEPRVWVHMAKLDLQTGIMKLVRAVAQPTTF